MKEIIHNSYNLKEEEINHVVSRVKILLINSKNEILLGYAHGIYQFIGGHVEENEPFIDSVIREAKEETGIDLQIDNIEPFLVIKHYRKDIPEVGKNRLSQIFYFIVNTDETIKLESTNYTDDEKEGNFDLRYIHLDNVDSILIENIPNNEQNKVIAQEMLDALNEYRNILSYN